MRKRDTTTEAADRLVQSTPNQQTYVERPPRSRQRLEKKRKDEPHGAVQRADSAKLYQGTVDIILCKDGTVAR